VGIKLSPPTIARLLKQAGYSLRVNHKKYEAGSNHPERQRQFEQLRQWREHFYREGLPVISVDTKKKELIGAYKQAGQSWGKQPHLVKAHDFPSEAQAKAVPYGIYDLRYNRGTVYVGESADTPEFAVAAIVRWWREEGRWRYNGAKELLILADSGGSNSCRARVWKKELQEKLCQPYGVVVRVCHYPTGCSKWNPIEHRLFGPISLNWAGVPLSSFEKLLGYLRGTTTKEGLSVRAERLRGNFEKGRKVSEVEMKELGVEWGEECPQWNYLLYPRQEFEARKALATKSGT
jgi:hypothetical protein